MSLAPAAEFVRAARPYYNAPMPTGDARTTSAAAAELEQQQEVREALEQAGAPLPEEPRPVETRHKFWLTAWVVTFGLFALLHYLVRLELLAVDARYAPLVQRISLGGMAIVGALALTRALDAFLICRLASDVTRFNLRRLIKLLCGVAIFFIVLSVLFASWYTAVVSLGLISLILGFALQTPITSFIGWIYVLVRSPYRVGDRIRIGDATGDVIDVSYLDTTLWEFGGEYLSTDHPSGRIIKFPNSHVLNTAVYNYSWPLFPYIWNEVKFQIAYDSDLDFVARTMQEVTEKELGTEMLARVQVYRRLLAKTPVDALEVREKPAVFFRVGDNSWLDATVRYLVEPRLAGRVKNRLVRELLTKLNAEPERVLFPRSNAR